MYIEQLYNPGNLQIAYYVESDGECAVIDPSRDIASVLQLIDRRKSTLRYIFESHIHSDFVSGHADLAQATGAVIVFGPGANTTFSSFEADDATDFKVGRTSLRVLHTPGHTHESICILLLDERKNPHSVFTGDTLLCSEGCREGLIAQNGGEIIELPGKLFDSIHHRLFPLHDYVVVYPGHGIVTPEAKSNQLHSTIGIQKKTHYLYKIRDKSEFIEIVQVSKPAELAYQKKIAKLNQMGYTPIDAILNSALKMIGIATFDRTDAKSILLDTRTVTEFTKEYIPGSIRIGLDGEFEYLVGTLLNPDTKIYLVADPGKEQETITRLAGVGFDQIAGYIPDAVNAWKNSGHATELISSVSATEFESRYNYRDATAIDVRDPDECIAGMVAGARLIPLKRIENESSSIDRVKPCFIYCTNGYRSLTAITMLKKLGFHNVVKVTGGINEIRKTGVAVKQLLQR